MSGLILDEYELGAVIGVGTVGTIYRAVDRKTGQQVAVKKLHPTVSQDPLIRARFRREMVILERLHHPNIIRYHGGGEEDGNLFYAMELVDGGTVKELLKSRGAFPWPMVVDITRQICSALQFAHNHGVVHRDLKPGNLFLSSDAMVKLGDFGIARDLRGTDITSSGMTVGTHAYMAPEQIKGDTSLSGKADLYSLGCCMFEMLVGHKPFYGDNFADLFDQHLKTEPPRVRSLIRDCPDALDQITFQLLAKNPNDRPFNARQVQAVMLQLDEAIPTEIEPGEVAAISRRDPINRRDSDSSVDAIDRGDVGAASVTSRGHELLRQQIHRQMNQTPPGEVSWRRLVAVMLMVIAVIVAATFLGR